MMGVMSRRRPRPTPQPVPPTPSPNVFNRLVQSQANKYGNLGKAILGTGLGALDVPVQAIGGMHRDAAAGSTLGGQSPGSRALQNYGQQVGGLWSDVFKPGAGRTEMFLPRQFDAAGEAAVDRFGLEGVGAGVVQGGATALDLLTGLMAGGVGVGGGRASVQGVEAADNILRGAGALKDIGVSAPSRFVMAAADPAAAQGVAGLTRVSGSNTSLTPGLQIPLENSSGMYAAILRNLARHRSQDPLLNLGVLSPGDVPVATGRAAGPGTYFGATKDASDMSFSSFGNEVYRIREPLTNVWDTVRNSPGYVTDKVLKTIAPSKSSTYPGNPTIDRATDWNDPLIQNLRDMGYLGYRYADDALTDWTVGAQPFVGLAKESGSSMARALADKVGAGKAVGNIADAVTGVVTKPVTAARNLAQQSSRKISDARRATENAYQKALKEYGEKERNTLKETFGSMYDTNPGLLPPAPPGYVPSAPPVKPGAFDFLRYVFGEIPESLLQRGPAI